MQLHESCASNAAAMALPPSPCMRTRRVFTCDLGLLHTGAFGSPLGLTQYSRCRLEWNAACTRRTGAVTSGSVGLRRQVCPVCVDGTAVTISRPDHGLLMSCCNSRHDAKPGRQTRLMELSIRSTASTALWSRLSCPTIGSSTCLHGKTFGGESRHASSSSWPPRPKTNRTRKVAKLAWGISGGKADFLSGQDAHD